MTTKEKIIEKIQQVNDPEMGIDIYTIGLIYDIDLKEEGIIKILMTLTTPFCPYADQIIQEVEDKVGELNLGEVQVDLTFEPAWKPPENLRSLLGV